MPEALFDDGVRVLRASARVQFPTYPLPFSDHYFSYSYTIYTDFRALVQSAMLQLHDLVCVVSVILTLTSNCHTFL